jgi:molybdopterin adenylyltransferase
MIRTGILTASDLGARGEREDTSGTAIRELIAPLGCEVSAYAVLPDDAEQISDLLRRWSDDEHLNLVLTTGGTGLGPRDVTPEATLAVIERIVPGLPEVMRMEGLRHTPFAPLSREVAGTRGQTLIVNLPGSEKGVRESLGAILNLLPHAIALLTGAPSGH